MSPQPPCFFFFFTPAGASCCASLPPQQGRVKASWLQAQHGTHVLRLVTHRL